MRIKRFESYAMGHYLFLGPTCNDGIQNQLETGVDCGGSCPACGKQKFVLMR